MAKYKEVSKKLQEHIKRNPGDKIAKAKLTTAKRLYSKCGKALFDEITKHWR